ncbi:conserved membrane hypothetical protein [Burkholderiales bacterium 8X]|nr:conserved membrane hypothetical protein [Burkholderiales bacterium 8X]
MSPVDLHGLPFGMLGSAIAWLYVITNAARLVTYIPQIVVVWRCRDGARSVSLLTWGSWVVANLSATLYGALVVRDTFFTAISIINLVCCAMVTVIAARRRASLRASMASGPRT